MSIHEQMAKILAARLTAPPTEPLPSPKPAPADFDEVYEQALEKARQAYRDYAEQYYKTPKYAVVQHANPMDDKSPVVAAYPMTDICGFVWLDIDGRDPFWRWMKRVKKVDSDDSCHYIKLSLGIGNGGNCDLTAQEKAYEAFAEHVRSVTGAKIYSHSRLD